MRRLILLLFLLLAPLAARADHTYDAYMEALGAANYWPLASNGNDLIGLNNGTISGSGTYGNPIAAHVTGFTPGTNTSYFSIASQSFTAAGGWGWAAVFTSTGTAPAALVASNTGQFIYISLNDTGQGCIVGSLDFGYVNGGGNHHFCEGSGYNDGNPHVVFETCSNGNCIYYADGIQIGSSNISFSSYSPVPYGIANDPGSTDPITNGAVGGVAFWFTNPPGGTAISGMYTCATTGVCPVPASTCPAHPGMQMLFCENWDEYLNNTGAAAIGWDVTDLGSATCAITGTAMMCTGLSGTFVPGMFVYDAGPTITLGTYIVSGSAGSYVVSQSQSVGSEAVQTGWWFPLTFIHNINPYSQPNAVVVGQNGGAVSGTCDSGGCTERHLAKPIATGILDYQGWFTTTTCSFCDWNEAAFGFGSYPAFTSVTTCGPCATFGSANSPPPGEINLVIFDADQNNLGNVNIPDEAWEDVQLVFKISTGSDGYVKILLNGTVVFSYRGPTTATPGKMVDDVLFAGEVVGGTPDAEAYFDNVGAYAPAASGIALWLQ